MLSISHLYKKYKNATVASIDDLSFSFQKGKIVGLLGPNGAGKTSTISIISGLIEAYEGEVVVFDKELRSHRSELKKQIGVVPQQIALYAKLSCKENLTYFGKLHKIANKELENRIEFYLHKFGLHAHAHKSIEHFSGGMKRRANIIATLLNNPQLLILDEPTAGVDVQSRIMILEFLREYNLAGNSIIYTSHLLEEAENICDEVLIIDQGKKIIQGKPSELIFDNETKSLEELFLKLTGHSVRD